MTGATHADHDHAGYREAAILLRAIGEDQAARSAMGLWPGDARRLGAALAGLGRVSAGQVDAVLGSFLEGLRSFGTRGTAGIGNDSGGDATAEHLQSLVHGTRAAGATTGRRRVMNGLRWLSSAAAARSLRRRGRSITGTALAYLEPVRAAAVLEALPADEGVRVLLQVAGASETLGGPAMAQAILRHLNADVRCRLTEAVSARAPALAQHLQV